MSIRYLFIFCLVICLLSLAGAAYLQYVQGLEPCLLCIAQRWAFIALTVWLVIAIIHNSKHWGQGVYGVGVIIFSSIGAFTAGRQVWLQHLPKDQQPECGPGFDYLLENFPLTETLGYIFSGDGNCAVVDWTFLGQSLATWALVLFLLLTITGLVIAVRGFKENNPSQIKWG